MVKVSYSKWEIAGKTVRAYGGKIKRYRHNMPVSDFSQIVDEIIKVYNKNGKVSKLDILNNMHNTKLATGKIFNKNSHEYKIKMAFDILVREKILLQKGIIKYYKGKKGRNPYAFFLNKP
jgi:hypothetical protein